MIAPLFESAVKPASKLAHGFPMLWAVFLQLPDLRDGVRFAQAFMRALARKYRSDLRCASAEGAGS